MAVHKRNPCTANYGSISPNLENSEESTSLGSRMEGLSVLQNSPTDVPLACSTGEPSFQSLAEELIQEILKYLPTTELLRNCRLVNKQWNRLASEVCRNRLVKVSLGPSDPELVDFRDVEDMCSLFDKANIPWSSITLFHVPNELKQKFFHSFGENLFQLRLVLHNDETVQNLINILQHTPNLRHLKVFDFSRKEEDIWHLKNTHKEISLRHLTRLDIEHVKHEDEDPQLYQKNMFEFLKFLVLMGGAKLEEYDVGFHPKTVKAAQNTLSLMPNLRRIAILIGTHLPTFHFCVEKLKRINVPTLYLYLYEVSKETGYPRDFEPFETFLNEHSEELDFLSLRIMVDAGAHSLPFRFPHLPSLESLSISFANHQVEHQDFTNSFLRLIEGNPFPTLTTVSLEGSGRWTDDRNNQFFPSEFSCETVNQFTVRLYFPVQDNWSRIFPNLTTLTCDLVYSEEEALFQIFCFTKLERLTLQLSAQGDLDPNEMFSGFINPESICRYQATDEEIEKERIAQGRPSIHQLTALKTLQVDFASPFMAGNGKLLNSAGAYLSFAQLHPLEHICFKHTSISAACDAELKKRHGTFCAHEDEEEQED